jgi:hypothetical protein
VNVKAEPSIAQLHDKIDVQPERLACLLAEPKRTPVAEAAE